MNKKNNLHLLGLLLAGLLILSCKLGGLTGKTTEETSTPTYSNTPSTPSTESIIKAFHEKAEELGKFSAAVKLNPKAKVKGKVALVTKSSSGYYSLDGLNEDGTYDEKDLGYYGLTKDDLALKVEEIDTLVQTYCNKGKQLGTYNTTDGRSLPAYALDCEVSVIDYKAPAIFARKTFIGKELDKNIKVTSDITERNAFLPIIEIGNYIKSLRGK